jgi:hypothetical protein
MTILERGNPPYLTKIETRTHFALIAAVEAAIPCLADWVKTTGFGETNKRDRDALGLCKAALEVLHEEWKS